MRVRVRTWHGVASWLWVANDENCGICRMAFNGCCPDSGPAALPHVPAGVEVQGVMARYTSRRRGGLAPVPAAGRAPGWAALNKRATASPVSRVPLRSGSVLAAGGDAAAEDGSAGRGRVHARARPESYPVPAGRAPWRPGQRAALSPRAPPPREGRASAWRWRRWPRSAAVLPARFGRGRSPSCPTAVGGQGGQNPGPAWRCSEAASTQQQSSSSSKGLPGPAGATVCEEPWMSRHAVSPVLTTSWGWGCRSCRRHPRGSIKEGRRLQVLQSLQPGARQGVLPNGWVSWLVTDNTSVYWHFGNEHRLWD
ncbi:anaphase-promoting complex subunit 11 isoform X1 [Falco biarmicus]|uniref:anaphase-promoting complex subunit 11 isoform X1 n=1 Tax=Falco biarmicus TaxID=345155 RepID=UPI0024BCF31D|nr:anaphase-promoting complex subunit 11 isoform X1 [Falco biarmicus]